MRRTFYLDLFIYLGLLALIIIIRCLVLVHFGFKYVDSDQTIMWLGLKNYAEGAFHEPRFYGQGYNTMMEAFFAVPLYKCGLPVYISLPIITTFFTLIPYVIISLFTFLKKDKKLACLILSIPLLLPIEYAMVTTIPRGFITGLVVAAIGCISLFYKKSAIGFLCASFTAVVAYSINANAVLLSIPCLAYLGLENLKNTKFYIFSGIGIVMGLGIHFLLSYFYIVHPYANVHGYILHFSFVMLKESFNNLDVFFNYVIPIFWNRGFLVLFIFLIISIIFFIKKEYNKAIIVLLTPVLILFTLGINKVHEGTTSVFMSFSRMYLSIPVVLGLFISLFPKIKTKYFYLYLLIPCTFFIYQVYILKDKLLENLSNKNHLLQIASVKYVKEQCFELKNICDRYNVNLVIIVDHWNYDIYDYGCPACISHFPNTSRPGYERRTWRLKEDEKTVYQNIMIITQSRDLSAEYNFIKKAADGFYIIENNRLYTMDLLDALKIEYRKYK